MNDYRMLAIGGGIMLGIAALSAPTAAKADSPAPAPFGSAAILTNRSCITTADGNCQLGSRTFVQYAGGAGSAFTTAATNENNSGASGSAYSRFEPNAVPTLGVASFAGTGTRTGASAMAYRTFTYGGNAAIDLALTGTLHYIGSGNLTTTGSPSVEAGGRGFFGANLGILPVSLLGTFGTTAEDLVAGPTTFTDCSSGAIASTFSGSLGTGAGDHSIPLSLTTRCDGGAITIAPGESFIVLATVQALSNMGGYLDASHTFSSYFDPAKTVFTGTGRAVGADYLAASITAVPEPASWAMMIAGFALGGIALRRARRVPVRRPA